jgi:hypothetical protein
VHARDHTDPLEPVAAESGWLHPEPEIVNAGGGSADGAGMRDVAPFALIAWLAACGPQHPVHRAVSEGTADAQGQMDVEREMDASLHGAAGTGGPASGGEGGVGGSVMRDAAGGGGSPDVVADGDRPADAVAPADTRAALDRSPVDLSPEAAAACPPPPAADEVIADFEGNQAATLVVGARGGTSWIFLPADGSGDVVATGIPERCGSRSALRVSGSGFAARTPLTQALLMNGDTSGARFYDGTAWKGLRLSLRAVVPGTARLKVPDRDTARPGGVCSNCNDHFAADLPVTTEWKTFTVLWTALRQEGTGDTFPALDAAHLFGIELFPPKMDGAFELWLDDVSFVR